MSMHTLTDEESLGRVVDRHETVVIGFRAPWCGPFRGFQPILEKAAQDHPDMAFCRVNTEAEESLARRR